MTRQEADGGLDFEALRRAIERCDPDLVLGFYAADARLSIVDTDATWDQPFELRGKAEIAKHLRTAFGQGTSHRIEKGTFGEERVTYHEVCEYPDGGRVRVETTLEVRDARIVRQVDVVAQDARADSKDEIGQRPPTRETHPEADVSPPDRTLRFNQATEKENLR